MAVAGIRVDRVSKRYAHRVKGEVWAVRDVSLDVAPGEFVTLLGPSGCGKTTTLRMIAGFERPDAGRVFIAGEDVTAVMANRRNIGFVFQNYALFPHLSVFENVAYGLRVQKAAEREITRAVGDVLSLVGLEGDDRQFPHQLSGGEQQRVALARAIVIRPRVLLFDEPLSNLDARLRVHMREELRALQKRLGITAVYVTHDQEEAMAISDRIAVMDRGVIVQEGPADDIYTRPTSAFVAQFFGRTNLLPARVIGVGPTGAEVEVGGHRVHLGGTTIDLEPGQAVRLLVRPESIGIAADGDGLAAEIVGCMFLGEKACYRVRAGSQTLEVTVYDPARRRRFRPGDRVSVELPREGVHVLPEGS